MVRNNPETTKVQAYINWKLLDIAVYSQVSLTWLCKERLLSKKEEGKPGFKMNNPKLD